MVRQVYEGIQSYFITNLVWDDDHVSAAFPLAMVAQYNSGTYSVQRVVHVHMLPDAFRRDDDDVSTTALMVVHST